MQNSRAQTKLVTLMIGVAIFVLAIGLAFPIQEVADEAQVNLNCTNATALIGDYPKASCLLIDISPFFFIGGLLGLVAIIVGARIIFAK